jgi:hypothetical protein
MQDSSTLKWLKTGFTACSTAFLATLIIGCGPEVEPPADADGDKIPDSIDNCVDVKNPAQTDADKDSIGDFCEQGFEYDFDNDGYTDVAAPGVDRNEDNCPTIADPEMMQRNVPMMIMTVFLTLKTSATIIQILPRMKNTASTTTMKMVPLTSMTFVQMMLVLVPILMSVPIMTKMACQTPSITALI